MILRLKTLNGDVGGCDGVGVHGGSPCGHDGRSHSRSLISSLKMGVEFQAHGQGVQVKASQIGGGGGRCLVAAEWTSVAQQSELLNKLITLTIRMKRYSDNKRTYGFSFQ